MSEPKQWAKRHNTLLIWYFRVSADNILVWRPGIPWFLLFESVNQSEAALVSDWEPSFGCKTTPTAGFIMNCSKHYFSVGVHRDEQLPFTLQEVISSTVNRQRTTDKHTLTLAKRLLPVLSLCRLYSNSLWHTFSTTSMNLRSLWEKTDDNKCVC